MFAPIPEIPESFKKYKKDPFWEVIAHRSINCQVEAIYAGVRVGWCSATPKDEDDFRRAYSVGTNAMMIIMQEYGQKHPQLYLQKRGKSLEKDFQANLEQAIARIQTYYPGIFLSKEVKYTEIVLPSDLEILYGPAFKVFLSYLVSRNIPKWEVPNTLVKY